MKNGKISIRPIRLMGYFFLLALNIILYTMLHSYFLWIFMIFLIAMPFFSFFGLYILAKNIKVSLKAFNKFTECQENFYIYANVENEIWWGALDACIVLDINNSFFGDETSILLSGPVSVHGNSKWKLPFIAKDPGRYAFSMNSIAIQDVLAIFVYEKSIKSDCQVFSIAKEIQQKQVPVSGFSTEKTSENESKKKGSDFAEVSDIREYLPGDRIRDIHWKLSSKQDKLMVKERIQVSGSEIIILFKPCEKREDNILLLANLYGLMSYFIEKNENVKYLFWNDKLSEFEEMVCDDKNNINNVFAEILSVNINARKSENLSRYLKNFYQYLTAYVLFTIEDGKLSLEVVDNV